MRSVLLSAALLSAVLLSACAVDPTARKEEAGRQVDPLVRERVSARVDEIAAPAKEGHATLLSKTSSGDCDGVCDLSVEICEAASRVCNLTSDYPNDEEMTEKCAWPTSDCSESRAACANCGGPTDPE